MKKNMSKKLVPLLVLAIAIPPFLYVFLILLSDFLRIINKFAWDDRPFIYIQINTIIAYLIYIFSALDFSLEIEKRISNNITKAGILAMCMSLFLFWLGFLFGIIGTTIPM